MKKTAILIRDTLCEQYIVDFIENVMHDFEVYLVHIPEKKTFKELFYDFVFSLEKKLYKNKTVDLKELCHDKFLTLSELENKKDITLFAFDNSFANLFPNHELILLDLSEKTAFWEVYARKDSVGFSILLLNQGEKKLLFEGKIATFRSVTQTKERVFRESLVYVKDILKNGGKKRGEKDTVLKEKKIPNALEILLYGLKTLWLYLKLFYTRVVQKKYTRFSVGFLYGGYKKLESDKGFEIRPPKYHFFADPFVWSKDDRDICFLEDYDYQTGIACISAVELFEDGSYKLLGEVLRESFHLSFPYLFEYQNNLYMMPEASQSKAVKLYKCKEFPMKWEFEQDIMSGVNTADSMVFPLDDKWWLLTNMATKGNYDQSAQLFAFYSDSPLSQKWTVHKQNPVVFDSKTGRNGGIVFDKNDIIRVRQKQKFGIYGAEFTMAKIKKLTTDEYEEELVYEVGEDFFKNINATHHLNSNGKITVYDFMRLERIDR